MNCLTNILSAESRFLNRNEKIIINFIIRIIFNLQNLILFGFKHKKINSYYKNFFFSIFTKSSSILFRAQREKGQVQSTKPYSN